ncbi:hypothetical protein X777_07176 [Ooceraea biroi]|uniref:Ionotropic glutamate receptor C-terminal domain-containing protein n=1 Tax=Ooceraea biroi TaxID=2015173 RepID=A0A026WD75_OOCBI|nr:hypothetical protein X777_07176 [Ooceraea biroi]
MKIVRTILYFFFAASVICSNLRQGMHGDQSIRKILRSIIHQDVIIRIQGLNTYYVMEYLLEIVTETVISKWPSQIFVLEEAESIVESQDMASSRTLLIYLYESDNDASYMDLTDTLTDIRLISYPKHMPKLLLIVGSSGHTLNALYQLKHLWALGFFDVVIMEVSLHAEHAEPLFLAAHRFNGFNDEYVKLTAYNDGVDWYPDKARNMYGNTLRVMFAETRSPYGSLDGESGEVTGLAREFSDALGVVLNATVLPTPLGTESNVVTRYEHTVTVGDDRICLLMPRLLAEEQVLMDFWPIIAIILIGLLVAAIVWYASRILRINERMRDPLNTISMILGISPLYKPRSLVEKILFVAMMMTAAEYTFAFQATLFEFVIEYAGYKRISTFEDLYKTGLKVLVSPIVYDELAESKDISRKFLKRFTPKYSFEDDLIKSRKTSKASKAFFMSEIDGKVAEIMIVNRKGDKLYRLSDLCIMSHYRVHSLPIRSPYRSEINGVLLSLTEYGFAKKHMDDFWAREGEKKTETKIELVLSDHSIYVAFIVLLVGYAIAIVAFVGEFTAARALERRNLFRSIFHIKCPQIIACRLLRR